MESIGSPYEIWCPACDQYLHDLWDLGIPLNVGATFFCFECGQLLEVTHSDGFTLKLRWISGGHEDGGPGGAGGRARPLLALR